MSEGKKVLVDAEALRQLLQALVGPPHHIRELQALSSAPKELGFDSPIDVLLEQYNGAQQWKHVKRGTDYFLIGAAALQTSKELVEGAELMVYIGDDGKLWVRPAEEFFDGRFEQMHRGGSK